jgi:hypothetical protein
MTPVDASAAASAQAVCLHEYAHLAVARHFGAAGFVAVARVAGALPPCHAGAFRLFGDLADDEWRVVALAGAVGECLAEEPLAGVDDIARRLEAGTALAGVDRELADGYTRDDVAACVAILRTEWSSVCADAAAHAQRLGCTSARER